MKLPNAERTVVDIVKLRDYCLNPYHPRGRHKARVFTAALGLTMKDAELLRVALQNAALNSAAAPGEKDDYGQRYIIDFPMTGLGDRKAIIRSLWIIVSEENEPRLISCYVI